MGTEIINQAEVYQELLVNYGKRLIIATPKGDLTMKRGAYGDKGNLFINFNLNLAYEQRNFDLKLFNKDGKSDLGTVRNVDIFTYLTYDEAKVLRDSLTNYLDGNISDATALYSLEDPKKLQEEAEALEDERDKEEILVYVDNLKKMLEEMP